ncbi:haloacid dehalogenase [Siphonobacter sp. BAB-5385]|uniref:HAD family hydrolase n=1 Tax=Siphonobacter sp. BAB-5385 TaxID=1864822 RepID=UPI000B9EDAA7|nr:HAD family phosphatase [Siphonobacter sp. BAB-5385]OZI08082.1 haloacid dehalogenase [Siphonobacter sp. BAB-5385]
MIKNLIFDMGNVIIDIDVPLTYRAFAELAGISEEEATRLFHEKAFFHQFEIGKINEADFKALLRKEFNSDWSDETIDTAWCTLLLDMPKARLDRIQELRKSYRVFLLSNTNPIHVREIVKRAAAMAYDFMSLFEKPFLSYEMGFMKPDPEFYRHALQEGGGLLPEESVFIDDNADNIESAATVGIQTIWLNPLGTVLDKLLDY